MDPNVKLGKAADSPPVNHARPEIGITVSLLSQYMHDPQEIHLQAAHHLLGVLKGNPGQGIMLNMVLLVSLWSLGYVFLLAQYYTYCTYWTTRYKWPNTTLYISKWATVISGPCRILL